MFLFISNFALLYAILFDIYKKFFLNICGRMCGIAWFCCMFKSGQYDKNSLITAKKNYALSYILSSGSHSVAGLYVEF